MAKEWGRKVHLLGGLMAGSTRELRIIALAEGRALYPQHSECSHLRSPPSVT